MNKALHVFVYLFLILAGAALYFELELKGQRQFQIDRGKLFEDAVLKLSQTIETEDADKEIKDTAKAELEKDVSPVEAKAVFTPDKENLLEDYKAYLEKQSLKTLAWGENERKELRETYVKDAEGKWEMDGTTPNTNGPQKELLDKLLKAAAAQQGRLNTTRGELVTLRDKLAEVVDEVNKLKPEARKDKQTIVEKSEKITKLEGEKGDLENQINKIKGQIEELNGEITSLKEEVNTKNDDLEATKEELDKSNKQVEQLKKVLQDTLRQMNGVPRTGGSSGTAVSSLPAGDKAEVVLADNDRMFCIIKFSAEAAKELRGGKEEAQLPILELGVKRKGFNGPAGEFVGRIRTRQEVPGKDYVICDILANWKQDEIVQGDIIFAD